MVVLDRSLVLSTLVVVRTAVRKDTAKTEVRKDLRFTVWDVTGRARSTSCGVTVTKERMPDLCCQA